MAEISASDLLKAIDKLQGEDLEKVKLKLQVKSDRAQGESDESFEAREVKKLEILREQQIALGEYNKARQTGFELLNALSSNAMADLKALRDEQAKAKEQNDSATLKEIERKIAAAEAHEELKKQLTEETDGYEGLSEAQKRTRDEFDKNFEGMATKIGLNSAAMNSFVSGLTKFKKQAQENPGLLRKSFVDTFSAQKMGLAILGQVVEASIELALAVETATAAFAANTGAGRILTEQISSVGGQFRNIGLDARMAGQAAQDLFNNFTGFMSISKAGQKDLMATVASLNKLGVDGVTASKALTLFNINMDMSLRQSQKLTKQLAMMGTQIGISTSNMVKGFVQASRSLAVYGKDAIKVFTDLAAQAKAANVETSTLLGIAERFDTFSGAADAAGKLNSILGTQMSATELLTMKENERIETLIRSVQAQGIAFKDLDRFSQKAIAAAAGISDMAEAQRIFGMSVANYRKGLRPDPREEEFQNALKDTMTIMEKLKRIGQQFAIGLAPFLDTIAVIAQKVLDLNDALGGFLLPTIAGVVAALVIVPKITTLFGPMLALFSTAGPPAGGGISIFGTALGAQTMNFLKGGGALAVVAASMLLLFSSFTAFGDTKMDGAAIFGFLSGLAGGLIALGLGLAALGAVAMLGGGLGFLAIAAGAAALAASIALIGQGLSTIKDLDALKSLGDVMRGFGDFMINFKVGALGGIEGLIDTISEADVRPVLGDIALVATGKTTQEITTNTVGYSLNSFAATFENIFKPEVTVKIGNEEFKDYILETQAEGSVQQ